MEFNTLKAAKEYLRKQSPLRLSKAFELTDKNPTDFIRNFVLHYNSDYDTIYDKNGKIQCETGHYRTASDIFRITYFYFPKVKLITVYRVLFSLIKEQIIYTGICSVICKRVYAKGFEYKRFIGVPTDELSIDFTKIPEFEGISYDHDASYLKHFNIPPVD